MSEHWQPPLDVLWYVREQVMHSVSLLHFSQWGPHAVWIGYMQGDVSVRGPHARWIGCMPRRCEYLGYTRYMDRMHAKASVT